LYHLPFTNRYPPSNLLVLPLEPVVVTCPAVTAGVVILVVEAPVFVVFTLFVATTARISSCLLVVVLPVVVVTRFEAAVTAGVVILDVVVLDTFTTTFPACEAADAVDTGGAVAPLLLYVVVCVVCDRL